MHAHGLVESSKWALEIGMSLILEVDELNNYFFLFGQVNKAAAI